MDLKSTNDPLITTLIDAAMVHQALLRCNGRISEAAKLLGVGMLRLRNNIEKHRELRLIWEDTLIQASEPPAVEIAITTGMDMESPEKRELAQQALSQMSEISGINSMYRAGFTTAQIKQFRSFSEFAGTSMKAIMQASHGSLAMTLMLIPERLKKIETILEDEAEIEHTVITKSGAPMVFMGPRYSNDIKVLYQREYRELLDLQRRITDTCNDTAALHLKAERRMADDEEDTKKKRRLKQVN